MSYQSKYTGQEIDNLLDKINTSTVKTILWEGTLSTINDVINLSNSLENYDYIGIVWDYKVDSEYYRGMPIAWLDTEQIKATNYAENVMFPTSSFVNIKDSTSRQLMCTFPSATQFKIVDIIVTPASDKAIKSVTKIIGLKLQSSTSSDITPVGTVISVMRKKAPEGYLICDGRELNIADYKALADMFEEEFGSKNIYGGDGITTFAIPDLRNEFLRGYYSDKEEQLSGEIGIHQDGTDHPFVYGHKNGVTTYVGATRTVQPGNMDTIYNGTGSGNKEAYGSGAIAGYDAGGATISYTARPTNVAVLYCIKY